MKRMGIGFLLCFQIVQKKSNSQIRKLPSATIHPALAVGIYKKLAGSDIPWRSDNTWRRLLEGGADIIKPFQLQRGGADMVRLLLYRGQWKSLTDKIFRDGSDDAR